MKKKQSLKICISFKDTRSDLEIYTFLNQIIKDEVGISLYIKNLVLKDMQKKKS